MAKKPNSPPQKNPDAVLVDKLLRDLQGPDDVSKPRSRPSGQIRGHLVGKAHFSDPVASPRERIGTWGRVWLTLALGIGLAQWPYANQCGWPLSLYFLAVLIAVGAGVWAGVVSWRWRMAGAHFASMVLVFWGVFLIAEQTLPRVGYAKVDATWKCVTGSTIGR